MAKEQITKNDKIYLARFSNDRGILGVLAIENDEDINKILAENRNTPLEVLKNLSSNDIYKDALNENYSFKQYEIEMEDEDFRKRHPIEQEGIIKMFKDIYNQEDLPIEVYNLFIEVDYNPLLHEMASYQKTPQEILNKLYDSKSYIIDYHLAKNPNCPQNIFEQLAKRKNDYLNLKLADNPNCPPNILEELSKTKNENMLKYISSNPNTPIEILEQLANHENEEIRINLVCNKNCSKEILEQLSKDESLNVKDYIPINPNVTREILESMSNDPDNVKELIDRCNRYIERLNKKEQSIDYDFER